MASSAGDTTASSGGSLTNWLWGPGNGNMASMASNNDPKGTEESEEIKHRKKLAQILHYIATMHHSLGGDSTGKGSGHAFVRRAQNHQRDWQTPFFQGLSSNRGGEDDPWGVLLSTQNFRRLLGLQAESSTALFESPPFSFYAANSSGGGQSPTNRKRGWSDAFRPGSGKNKANERDGKACWLRMTRLVAHEMPEPPSLSNPAVKRYLQQWRDQNAEEFQYCSSLRDMLTLQSLERAPKIAPADFSRAKEIKTFLKNYKNYLRKRAFQQALEPMYNQVFEWAQQTQHSDELVWGLGHARMITGDNTVVNGPLLEILMEVELARDGALLVRPREHTGVALNREVIAALMSPDDGVSLGSAGSTATAHQRSSKLHQQVSELDPLQMAPGQPATYIPFLKRLVVELSASGSFQMSAKASDNPPGPNKMLVTEAWCLYTRPKPRSVWARDAMAFEDQLLLPPDAKGGLELPKAAWALTHGPGALDDASGSSKREARASPFESGSLVARLLAGSIFSTSSSKQEVQPDGNQTETLLLDEAPIVFPLPTSESQNRIAELLLRQNYPAIVTEGPPGTGKTHTIANMISAYLCQGKRVLITSKAAPALSVIRSRLPKNVQDLCVDVSLSELAGMRQLQQTVERLANRVSCVSTNVETEKCLMLLRNIAALERERLEIDSKLAEASDRVRGVIQNPNGQRLVSGLIELNENVPWLMKTLATWTLERLKECRDQVSALVAQQNDDTCRVFLGCPSPPPLELVSLVAANAGVALSSVKQATRKVLASVPLLGSVFGLSEEESALLQGQLDAITLDGKPPKTKNDWKQVLEVLRFEEEIEKFDQLVKSEGWPETAWYNRVGQKLQQRMIQNNALETLERALILKELAISLSVAEEMQSACKCSILDARRGMISSQMQRLAEDLVDAKVVTELSRSFSAEAQSALIRFSQIAGKARFSRSSQPSKMTVRQRRHRQEYLDAFDRCVRYIPCWIMTSSQISDYLPAECLFDLVVIDEASQSDITVLPGMLRGKQWLIVGDGKQVSPTESFISEESIDSLRAALPRSPLEDSLLPGQSFFDLCAQAYPKGRVVLSEHFRCAPEIISFSNLQFYDDRLVPLRLPTSSERLAPSLVDVRVQGSKVGKVNEGECDEIVRMVESFVLDAATQCALKPRSIGIISLLGDDQSKLIRGRLLDRIGPSKFKEHNILVGDPPTFQGAERDVVYLSMVCSPGSVPTQNRLMHAQRINVALSRARDRMVLVRSIDAQHIPNSEDIKHSVVEFFEEVSKGDDQKDQAQEEDEEVGQKTEVAYSFRVRAEALLEKLLKERGYTVRNMGVVWNHALCVEHPGSTARAGLSVENAGESKQEWTRVTTQQRSIERVGWKCLRVDGLSLLMDHHRTMVKVLDFLAAAGVEEPPMIYDSLEEEDEDVEMEERGGDGDGEEDTNAAGPAVEANANAGANADQGNRNEGDADEEAVEAVVISSDDENEADGKKIAECFPEMAASNNVEALLNDHMQPSQFGEVVQNLGFMMGSRAGYGSMDERSVPDTAFVPAAPADHPSSRRSEASFSVAPREEAYMGDQSDLGSQEDAPFKEAEKEEGEGSPSKRRRRYRRLDKYSRDGRYFPGKLKSDDVDDEKKRYDTDSDLPSDEATAKEEQEEDEDYKPSQV